MIRCVHTVAERLLLVGIPEEGAVVRPWRASGIATGLATPTKSGACDPALSLPVAGRSHDPLIAYRKTCPNINTFGSSIAWGSDSGRRIECSRRALTGSRIDVL
jgi:hypothetical protein